MVLRLWETCKKGFALARTMDGIALAGTMEVFALAGIMDGIALTGTMEAFALAAPWTVLRLREP